jgi:trimeric autotransporter adhesin
MALQIRRGTDAERTAGGGVVFAEGELVYVTDTDALYVGDGSTAGGVKLTDNAGAVLGSYITADTVSSTLDLQQNLDLNGKDIIGTGNINISGTINATGNVNIGDDVNTDTVDFAAKITSGLTPNADSTYNIGTTTARWNNGYFTGLVVDGQVDAVAVNADVVADNSTVMVDVSTNIFAGALTGSVTGNVLGDLTGDSAGTHTGAVVGNTTGYHTGDVKGSVFGDDSTVLVDAVNNTLSGNLTGNVVGDVTGDVTGNVTGQIKGSGGSAVLAPNTGPADAVLSLLDINATGTITGAVTGNVTGNTAGYHTGDVKGSVFGDDSTVLVDAVSNTLSGNLTGNVTGDTAGTHTGAVVGNVTGNTAGYHTGDVKGSVFGDDSTVLVDAVNNKIIGAVESASIIGTVVTADLLKLQENRIIALPGLDPATTYAAEGGIPFIDFNISTAVDEVFLSVGETAGLSLSAITDPTQRSAVTIAANVNGSGASHTLSSSAYRSPTAGFASGSTVQNNDTLYLQTMAGFDGSNDIISSQIKSTASSVSVGAITSTLEIKVTDDAGVSYSGLEISPSAVASTLPIQFPVVADDTARGTLVPTPAAGMMLFMTAGTSPSATTQLQVYNGTAWVNV